MTNLPITTDADSSTLVRHTDDSLNQLRMDYLVHIIHPLFAFGRGLHGCIVFLEDIDQLLVR